jgi:hypothetical protein
MNIKQIIEAILDYRFWITDHADEEAEEDQLSFDEIYHSVLYGEIIEDYPNHQPYPRCLIYGENFATEPIHSVWDYDQETDTAILITVYRPDPKRWINGKIRRYS